MCLKHNILSLHYAKVANHSRDGGKICKSSLDHSSDYLFVAFVIGTLGPSGHSSFSFYKMSGEILIDRLEYPGMAVILLKVLT